jgi:hypothetical protein
MIIIYRVEFGFDVRHQIAYYIDVIEGEKTRAQWNKKPRLATRKECLEFIEGALDERGSFVGDYCPNMNVDGTTDDTEDDGEMRSADDD